MKERKHRPVGEGAISSDGLQIKGEYLTKKNIEVISSAAVIMALRHVGRNFSVNSHTGLKPNISTAPAANNNVSKPVSSGFPNFSGANKPAYTLFASSQFAARKGP